MNRPTHRWLSSAVSSCVSRAYVARVSVRHSRKPLALTFVGVCRRCDYGDPTIEPLVPSIFTSAAAGSWPTISVCYDCCLETDTDVGRAACGVRSAWVCCSRRGCPAPCVCLFIPMCARCSQIVGRCSQSVSCGSYF